MAQETHNRKSQKVKFRDHIVDIQTVNINGIECLRLKDVRRKFPAVQILSIDNVHQAFLHDEHGNDLEPLRIAAGIGKVVEAEESLKSFDNDAHDQLARMNIKLDRIDANTQEILRQIDHVMTQMYELHEFTTPRYFFILPAEHSNIKAIDTVQNWLHIHYKLYFLCECSQDPKEMHVAPHEACLIESLQHDEFISRLCISSSTISSKLTKALLHAGEKRDTFTYLEFYNCQVSDDEQAKLQSLYENGRLHQLGFYEQPRWLMMLEKTNESLNRGKKNKKSTSTINNVNGVEDEQHIHMQY
ncbi:unnamed protein product [Rotaria socialis]